ncbi:MAG TPA: NAD(P)/FAD-dependent oxidoreductase [Acidimicrobiales bacterium]
MAEAYDAIVIGAGPNGLVAANHLVDAGWHVLVLEAAAGPGGAVRTAEVTAPGFRNDLFSAFYPLAVGSSVLGDLGLERHGLRWTRAPAAVAHPTPDGPAAVLHHRATDTAASLDRFAPGDGDAWLALVDRWRRVSPQLLGAMLSPMPPVRHVAALLARLRRDLLPFARFALLPVRRMADEHFRGAGGGLLLAGNALHADVSPDAAPSGALGWLLTMLGQDVGFPVPVGGAGELTGALVRRLESGGGRLRCGAPVERVVVRRGRAVGVEVAGSPLVARHAVLAAVDAEVLFRRLVGPDHLPAAIARRLRLFQRGWATVKADWALRSPVPWSDPDVAHAGTVHLAGSIDELSLGTADILAGRLPRRPFVVFGQMTTADATRSPAGTESAWAYSHVPARLADDAGGAGTGGRALRPHDVAAVAQAMEDRIEAYAPGFRDRILARYVAGPRDLEAADPSLVGGDIGGGTYQLHQQLVFRPWPGLGRPETPIGRLYLASASAHPGGGVHGACGANAARAALAHARLAGILALRNRRPDP